MGKRTAGTTRQEQIKSGQIQEQKIRPAIGSTEGTPKEAAGLQTFQIGNKVVSKADFESFINSEKVTLAAQGTPDLTPGAQPFDKPREAGVQPTAGRTAEQFQQIQQQQEALKTMKTQQVQEQQALTQQFPEQAPLTTSQRNVLAGEAVFRNIRANLGSEGGFKSMADLSPEEVLKSNILNRAVLGTVGIASTLSVGGFSLSTLFAPESSSITNLKGDVADINQETKFVVRMATSKDADVLQALKTAELNEAKVRNRYNQANQALRKSPQDIRKNLDLTTSMKTDLSIAMGYRQMLERYAITLNPNEIMTSTNDFIQ